MKGKIGSYSEPYPILKPTNYHLKSRPLRHSLIKAFIFPYVTFFKCLIHSGSKVANSWLGLSKSALAIPLKSIKTYPTWNNVLQHSTLNALINGNIHWLVNCSKSDLHAPDNDLYSVFVVERWNLHILTKGKNPQPYKDIFYDSSSSNVLFWKAEVVFTLETCFMLLNIDNPCCQGSWL